MPFVVTLENVLLGDIPKDCDGLIEDGIYFGIRFLVVDKSDIETNKKSDNSRL
jgi:hypothetical protein